MEEIIIQEDNQIDSVKLRRYSNRLVLSGWGIIVLGIWGSIRLIMGIVFYRNTIMNSISSELNVPIVELQNIIFAIFVIIILLVGLISFMIHLYIGGCAMLDGRGKKRKNLYLLFAAGLIMLSFLSQEATDNTAQNTTTQVQQDMDLAFATDLLDFTLCINCAEMIYCAARTKILRRKRKRQIKEAR